MGVFGWWCKKDADSGVEVRPTASEVDTEYAEYASRIRKAMVLGAVVGVFGTAFLYVYSWSSTLSAATGSTGLDQPAAPKIVLDPLPSSLTLAGFSLLAAVAIALQLAVRTPSETETRPATVLARRRFLCSVAGLVVPATFALAVYSIVPTFSSGPEHFDVVRMFGPVLCGVLVALIAADAGVASDPDFAPAELGRVWRARLARRRLEGLRMVGDSPKPVRARSVARQVLTLIGVPVLIALTSSLAAPDLHLRQRFLLIALALGVSVIVYAIAAYFYMSAVMRNWLNVAFTITLVVIFGTLCWLMFVTNTLQSTADSRSLAPAMTTFAWAVVYVAVPSFLAVWSLAPYRDRRPRLLGLIVKRVLLTRLRNRNRGLQPAEGPAYNTLALIAPWVSPLVPFGLVLGVIARQQILRSQHAPTQASQRGTWAANLAIGLTVLFVVILIGAALIVATIDPPEWDDFIWG